MPQKERKHTNQTRQQPRTEDISSPALEARSEIPRLFSDLQNTINDIRENLLEMRVGLFELSQQLRPRPLLTMLEVRRPIFRIKRILKKSL